MNEESQEAGDRNDEKSPEKIGGTEQVEIGETPPPEEEPIEGGNITGLDEPLSFNQARHEANTARMLSYLLVAVLAGYFVLHYAATFAAALWLGPEAQEVFQNIYNAGLPVLSGLAGSAATYFFTRRNA